MAELIDTTAHPFGEHTVMARLANGDHVVIDVDPGHLNAQAQDNVDELLTFINAERRDLTHVVRPTVVLRCDAEGLPVDGDLTPLHRFPPGTTAEQALAQLEQE